MDVELALVSALQLRELLQQQSKTLPSCGLSLFNHFSPTGHALFCVRPRLAGPQSLQVQELATECEQYVAS